MARIFGIVNVTRDSFSDGGRWLLPEQAIAHGEALLVAGADVLDLGAESTHPDAEDVSAADEIARLDPVVRHFVGRGAEVSIDTCKPAVMRRMAELGATWWNDVDGLRSPAAMQVAAALPAQVRFVVMYSRGAAARATRAADERSPAETLTAVEGFFVERLAALANAGIAAGRVVLDPGMGFFLGATPGPSLYVLKHLDRLRRFGADLLVSVSRKSFLGAVTGLPTAERGPATLAAELAAVRAGAAYVRTHDAGALRAALRVQAAIEAAE
ncbi:MAG: dihydropteroate synthase [Planctomycetota bacterium]|jgi:dihydropteroate synthase type 2